MPNNLTAMMLALCLGGVAAPAHAAGPQVIEIQPKDFIASYLLEEEGQVAANIRQKNAFTEWAFAEVGYAFEVPAAGWWEFWLQGNNTPFDLIIDGRTLIHAPIASGVWAPDQHLQKMLNVWLTAGRHTLRLSKPEPYGIPGVSKMQFRQARDLAGMVRAELVGDRTVIRKGEGLALTLVAGQGAEPRTVRVATSAEGSKEEIWSQEVKIPAGAGNVKVPVHLPDDKEGSFDVTFTDPAGRAVDRTIQYLVVDVTHAPPAGREPERELVQEIDCGAQAPDYASAATRVIPWQAGDYRESGARGRQGYNMNADWFAYTLKLPTVQDLYLAEIDYPDDDERVTLIALLERAQNPYSLALGYASGGIYSLSHQMQTQLLYFYPREQDPRLFFQNWKTGMKSAAARIRVYKLAAAPAGPARGLTGRTFGGYQEENIRFTTHYGSTPDGNGWNNYFKSINRFGRHYQSMGGNFWQPTIGNYQEFLWPSKTTKGYAAPDIGGYALAGPQSLNDPIAKDIVRLQLLVCEKYGMGMIGELHIPPNRVFKRHMDKVFGGTATIADNGPHKPWLAVSRTGALCQDSLNKPYWNVFYPGVQDWTASVIAESANRYKDSPAFKGLCVRLMSWVFGGWQTVASIDWGYEDYTIGLFEKDTGIKVAVAGEGPDRFAKRYAWLMANAYDPWVNWRCAKIYAYHSRLAQILTRARPDLKLYLSTYGPIYDRDYNQVLDWKDQGWNQLIKEAGIDTALYNNNPAIIVQSMVSYPSSSSRAKTPLEAAVTRDQNLDPGQFHATAHAAKGGGTYSVIHFDADSFEGDFCETKAVGFSEMKGNNKRPCGNGVINPAGVHCMERFAEAMAAGNVISISDGSHGYDQQQPQYLKPFIAEYRSLPVMGMTPVEVNADPVAAWQGVAQDRMYFYVVNRLDQPVEIALRFDGPAMPVRLATREPAGISNGSLGMTLAPYELRAYEGGAAAVKAVGVKAVVAASVGTELLKQIAFSEDLISGRSQEFALIHLSPADLNQTAGLLAEAKAAVAHNRVRTARAILLSAELTKLYEAFHSYPSGLYFKKAPVAPPAALLPSAAPSPQVTGSPALKFEKAVGDVRGQCSDNISVAVADDGSTFLLMRSGHVAVFDNRGTYLKTLETQLPYPAEHHYISARGKLVLQGACTQDYPWVYAATRQGSQAGCFNHPGMVVADAAGTLYVADTGNQRVQIFAKGNLTTPAVVIPVAAGPVQLAVMSQRLAVASQDGSCALFEVHGKDARLITTRNLGDRIRAMVFGPDGALYIAQSDNLKKHAMPRDPALAMPEPTTIAVARTSRWPAYFPGHGPLVAGPDGMIYFATSERNKLLALNPADDSMRECGTLPHMAKTIAFAANGSLVTSSQNDQGVRLESFKLGAGKLEPAGAFAKEPIYNDIHVPVWGLLADADGSIYLRMVDTAPGKGWPALSIKTITPAGSIRTLLDFGGSLYGKWTAFAPSEGYYSLKFDHDHNMLFAATPLLAVSKVTTGGQILWRSGTEPYGSGEQIEFAKPRDVASDRAGNVWVVDSGLDQILCLSPAGKLLLRYGRHATLDDTSGAGFDRPSGISIAQVNGSEYLYVGDSGNQRLVKFKIVAGKQ